MLLWFMLMQVLERMWMNLPLSVISLLRHCLAWGLIPPCVHVHHSSEKKTHAVWCSSVSCNFQCKSSEMSEKSLLLKKTHFSVSQSSGWCANHRLCASYSWRAFEGAGVLPRCLHREVYKSSWRFTANTQADHASLSRAGRDEGKLQHDISGLFSLPV